MREIIAKILVFLISLIKYIYCIDIWWTTVIVFLISMFQNSSLIQLYEYWLIYCNLIKKKKRILSLITTSHQKTIANYFKHALALWCRRTILLWKWCRVAGLRRNLFHFRNPRQSFAGGIRALIISTAIHAPVIAASTRNALNRYLSRTQPTTKESTIPSVVFNYNGLRIGFPYPLVLPPDFIPRFFIHPSKEIRGTTRRRSAIVTRDKNRRTFIILNCSLQ